MLSEHNHGVSPSQPAFSAPSGSLPPTAQGEEALRRDIKRLAIAAPSMDVGLQVREWGKLWDRATVAQDLSAETLFLVLSGWLPHAKVIEGDPAARALCERAIRQVPEHSPYRISLMVELAQLKEDAEESEAAHALYSKAFSTDWNDDFGCEQRRKLWLEGTYLPLFVSLLSCGMPTSLGARTDYQRRAVEAVAHLPEASAWHARVAFFQADLWRGTGELQQAGVLYRQAWQLARRGGHTVEPWMGELCFHLGAIASEEVDARVARRWFLRASCFERRNYGPLSVRQLGGLAAAVQMSSILGDGASLVPLRLRIDAITEAQSQPPHPAVRWAQFVLSAAECSLQPQPSEGCTQALFQRSAELLCAPVEDQGQTESVVNTLFELVGPAAVSPLIAAVQAQSPTADFQGQLQRSFLELAAALERAAKCAPGWEERRSLHQAEAAAVMHAIGFAAAGSDALNLRFDAGLAYESAGLAIEARGLYEAEMDYGDIDDAERLTFDHQRQHALSRTALVLGLLREAEDSLRWLWDEFPAGDTTTLLAMKHEISTWRSYVAIRLRDEDLLAQMISERGELRRALRIREPDPLDIERRAHTMGVLDGILRREGGMRRLGGGTQQWVLRRIVRFANPEAEDPAAT